ncbi:hypothetical protein [Robiginitalea sp.]|uniref:hypothetical protein n=1 Tax=Robiginitalea sp. TaxID=1902411 RepID=UPI003C3F1280
MTVTLPAAIYVSASLREQTPALAMYLLSRIFPGSELDALAAPEGRFRNVGFFEGSHDPGRRSSPDRF